MTKVQAVHGDVFVVSESLKLAVMRQASLRNRPETSGSEDLIQLLKGDLTLVSAKDVPTSLRVLVSCHVHRLPMRCGTAGYLRVLSSEGKQLRSGSPAKPTPTPRPAWALGCVTS
jgi:hypothetical protein